MEQLDEIVTILRRHLAGDLSEMERAHLAAWAASHAAYRDLLRELSDEETLHSGYTHYLQVFDDATTQRLQRIEERLLSTISAQTGLPSDPERQRPRRLVPKIWWAAAAVLLVASVVGWWAISILPLPITNDFADIQPGGNRATLTLADGRVIDLDEAQTGIVVGAEDITYDDGSTLEAVTVNGVEGSLHTGQAGAQSLPRLVGGDVPVMLALSTPKGGTYQITLPDGSKVWLNANSILKYPSRFSDESREVILEGEAFFDIRKQAIAGTAQGPVEAHDYAPFSVLTAGQVVQVLGTQFNISAYAEEPETKTTLVEGSVKVTPGTQTGSTQTGLSDFPPSLPAGRQGGLPDYMLKPGQQAITRDAATTINEVDTEQYTAWRDGWFIFRGTSLADIMREVSRWYAIDVDYASLPDRRYYGEIKRNVPLSDVLKMITANGHIDFTWKEGRLTAME